jgi:hypothetical protein
MAFGPFPGQSKLADAAAVLPWWAASVTLGLVMTRFPNGCPPPVTTMYPGSREPTHG